MDTRIIKIGLTAASLAYSISLFLDGYVGAGVGMVLVTAVLVLACIQSIRLIVAFAHLRQQKMDSARKWLARINPNHLWRRRRAYYHFLMGSLAMEHNMNVAEKSLKEALRCGLKQGHDKAAAKLNLAVIASSKRRVKEAKVLLGEAKRLDTKKMLKKDITMVENALRNPQQMMHRKGRGR